MAKFLTILLGRSRKTVVSVLAIADQPDLNGNIFSLEALQTIAEGTEGMWIEDNRLMGEFEVKDDQTT